MKRPRIRTILGGLTVFGIGWFTGIVWTSFQVGYSQLMRKNADEIQAARKAKADEMERHPTYVPLPFDPGRVDRLRGRLS